MKIKTNLAVLLLVALMCSFSAAKEAKTDRSEMKLTGKVRSVRQISYLGVERDGKPSKAGRADEVTAKEHDSFTLVFNAKGNKVERQWLKLNDSLETRHTYKYSAGKLTEETREGELRGKCFFKYDAGGNRAEESCYDEDEGTDSKIVYKYDEKGNLAEQACADCSPSSKTTYKYDEKGNLTETSTESDEFLSSVSKYDEKGNAVEVNSYDLGTPTTRVVNQYDDKGNLAEATHYAADGSVSHTLLYKYAYDKHGNWVQQAEYDGGTPKYILERTIQYFDNGGKAAAGKAKAKTK